MSGERVEKDNKKSARASSLDLDEKAMRALSDNITTLVADYFAGVSRMPVFPDAASTGALVRIKEAALPREGEALEEIVADCRAVIRASRHNGHPRFFGYVASPSTPVGAYADLFASALNSNVTSWRSAPAATAVERVVVRWLAEMVGYARGSHGLLTSGGSMANLTALLIAHRARASRDVSRKGLWSSEKPMTIYASDQTHLSIAKAADVLGLGRDQVRFISSDEKFRLDVRDLRERIAADQSAGVVPFCVVANAGTVNTGAIDPLAEAALVAKEYGLWLHVDGAYGAPAALDQTKRSLLNGLERADSLALDAHKWLYAPVDCGCLLLRDAECARAAFSQSGGADYIKVQETAEDEAFAFWDYGMELSRRARSFKVWMMLRYYGARRLGEAIAEDNRLAQYMAARVEEAEDFELLAPVSLSICCFRYAPQSLRARLERAASADEREVVLNEIDSLNTRVMHAVQRGGRAYISNATLRGRFSLRACITNFRTTRADVDTTLDVIRDAARELGGA